MKKPPSLIKWTGSKRSQATDIAGFFPCAKRYIEPFLGGGAILYHATQKYAECLGTDIYEPLIEIWDLVKTEPLGLCENYENNWNSLQNKFPNYYYEVRSRFNSTKNGEDLLFLSRTCTNGIIRFNQKGEFNNSLHVTRRGMKPNRFKSIVLDWSKRLKTTTFSCNDFSILEKEISKDDFFYLDPPYLNNKQRYISDLNPNKLYDFLEKANTIGAKWLLSYDGTRGTDDFRVAIPKDLYKHHELLYSGNSAVKKVLSSKTESVHESIYMNYHF